MQATYTNAVAAVFAILLTVVTITQAVSVPAAQAAVTTVALA